MSKWQEESVANRAKALAHCLHRNLREAYSSEKAMEKGDKKSSNVAGNGPDYGSLMRSMGLA